MFLLIPWRMGCASTFLSDKKNGLSNYCCWDPVANEGLPDQKQSRVKINYVYVAFHSWVHYSKMKLQYLIWRRVLRFSLFHDVKLLHFTWSITLNNRITVIKTNVWNSFSLHCSHKKFGPNGVWLSFSLLSCLWWLGLLQITSIICRMVHSWI